MQDMVLQALGLRAYGLNAATQRFWDINCSAEAG